jgi:hypothetical protein
MAEMSEKFKEKGGKLYDNIKNFEPAETGLAEEYSTAAANKRSNSDL